MLVRLLLAFIVIPFVELVLLLRMADATSWMTTLLIVIVTGVIGSILARREGLAAISRFRSAVAEGRMPGKEIQDGLMIVFAAALLLTPGLLTDAAGFVLLTPWGRRWLGSHLSEHFSGRLRVHTSGFGETENSPSRQSEKPRSDGYTIDSPSFGPKASIKP